MTIEEIISINNRLDSASLEVAMYRLAHRGKVNLGLDKKPLTSETEVELC